MARPERPHIAAPSRPSAPSVSSARPSRQQQIETRATQREQRIQQRQQALQQRQQGLQERQRGTLARETTARQGRIDRLQQRVQELQSKKPEGLRAQRAQERLLQTQNRQLERERRALQGDQARLQKLGPSPQLAARSADAMKAAARGRFAARFAGKDAFQAQAALAARQNRWAPRDAWRHRRHATFVAFLGPVFWPYAYSDIFEYTFWPYAYEPGYWDYAYDDFVDTVFWGADNRYSAYASYPAYGTAVSGGRARERETLSSQTFRQLCGNPQAGVTAWPIESIARAVKPTAEQRALLDDLKAAAAKAADAFKQSCEDSFALTPPGRLRAMTNRIRATLEAVKIVRPALERFYASLSDEQQARFNALRPKVEGSEQQDANATPEESCGDPKSSLTQLPIERIESVVKPAGKQKEALDRLGSATADAVKTLQAACPDSVPQTPVGRMEAMQKRLEAMLAAADLVQPALDEFYAGLSVEQKARFNTMPRVAEE